MSILVRNEAFIPHQAIVLTNQQSFDDFSLKKVASAYNARKNCLGTDAAIWEIEIHPTNCCNLHCNGCSYGTRHDNSALSISQLQDILSPYLSYSPQSIFFSGGGDPLLWDSWELFFRVFAKQCKYGISTNFFNFKAIDKFWTLFDFYQIHVTGYNESTVKETTGVSCFSQIEDNISFILENKLPHQTITLKIVIDNNNYKLISNYLSYVMRKGIDSIVLKYQQDFLHDTNLATEVINDYIRREVGKHPIVHTYDYLIDNLDDVVFSYPRPDTCLFANSGLYKMINAKGEVYPCIAANANAAKLEQRKMLKQDIYTKYMLEGKCPLRACRHYRFSKYLFSLSDMGNDIGNNISHSKLL